MNIADAPAWARPRQAMLIDFEPDEAPWPDTGVNVQVMEPGQPNSLYHSEPVQEDFLVLRGECILIVDGEERRLRQWDFVHCPAGVEHVFVGAGDEPCAVLMVGFRSEDEQLLYPASELAARHGASAEEETSDPRQAYAPFERARPERPAYWDRLPWSR